jgi:hypothetical protein
MEALQNDTMLYKMPYNMTKCLTKCPLGPPLHSTINPLSIQQLTMLDKMKEKKSL